MRAPSLVPMTATPDGRGGNDREQAGQGAVPEPVTVAENSRPAPPRDSPAEAEGRRTLSTAFVMMGPGGHLTVELHDGRAIVLRDVVMRRKDYCGVQVVGGAAGTRYCGAYGDLAAARPGGMPTPDEPNPAALNPAGPARIPSGGE